MLKRNAEFLVFEMWNKEITCFIQYYSVDRRRENLLDIGQITFLEYAIAIFLANPTRSFENARFKGK